MTMWQRLVLVPLLVACGSAPPPAPTVVAREHPATPAAPAPPVAKKVPTTRTLHGDTFVDDYAWLTAKGSPDVLAYLAAEDAYADQIMAPLAALQQALYDEIVSHIAEDDDGVPAEDGEWLYWRRMRKGLDHPIYLRRRASAGAPEEVVLDQNALAAGHAYLGVGTRDVDDAGRLLLYTTDTTGFRDYTLRVRDLTTGADLPDTITGVVDAEWTSKPGVLVYTVQDAAKRPHRALLHVVGDDPAKDKLLYEEADARFELYVWRTPSREHVILHSESKLATEVRLVDARRPDGPALLIEPRRDGHLYDVESLGGALYIRTNDQAPTFRIAKASIERPGRAHWKPLVPARADVMVDQHTIAGGALVIKVRDGGMPELEVVDLRNGKATRIALPDPVHEVSLDAAGNLDPRATTFRYTYESLATPRSTFEHDPKTGTSRLLKEDSVPGGFDRTRYVAERVLAKAADGTSIPIALVRRRDVVGPAPAYLYAYGAYGISIPLRFSPARLALLDRGVVFAVAQVRGGGELGKPWHEAGRLAHKMNTFTDFIACAEHLVATGVTTPDRLAIEGGSAGGLLVGAVINLRPDLFRVAVAAVPFVDVINTMNDPSLPLTITEYEEWGNPGIAEQYAWIRPYSPYDNVRAAAYPAMLVRTSYHDSQVMYWEPAKWVARLRALGTGDRPLLFKINLEAGGHGGKSGRYAQYRDIAFDQAFLLWQLGLGR